MLQPKKTKFRKMHKMVPSGNSRRGNTLAFGSFGIKAMETVWITSRQIEAARVALTRHLGREAKVWIRIFPDKPITKKSPGTRMGKGKGNPEYWVAVVKSRTSKSFNRRNGIHSRRIGRSFSQRDDYKARRFFTPSF